MKMCKPEELRQNIDDVDDGILQGNKPYLLVDPDPTANRGILFADAGFISAGCVNIMARWGRGVVSAALDAAHAFSLGIPPQTHATERAGRPV